MRRLTAFESISADGFFTDAKNDMTWAHAGNDDPEFAAFTARNAGGDGCLVFGRTTYEMMVSFWPTPAAKQQMPEIADGMNRMPKIVFSRTLTSADWTNTTLINDDPATAIARLKGESGPNMTILGSGSIVSHLAEAGLVDEFQFVVCPTALGQGRSLFETVTRKLELTLTSSRTFKNGKVLLCYTT